MSTTKYPLEKLKKWQDDVLEVARKNLRKDGELRPVAFFLAEKMGLDEDLLDAAVTVGPTGDSLISLKDTDIKPANVVVLALDLAFSSEDALDILQKTNPSIASIAPMLEMLQQVGRDKFNVKDPAKDIVKALLRGSNMQEKDIVAMAIALFIKKTDAIAYIKLDESWMVEAKTKELGTMPMGSLENHPDSKEALISFLETDGYTRALIVPFKRNRPKTGRIIGFDPTKEHEDVDGAGDSSLSGRFTHIFQKAKDMAKTPPPAGAN
jgi:hypothetical protein